MKFSILLLQAALGSAQFHRQPTTCDNPVISNQSDIDIVSQCPIVGKSYLGLQINESIAEDVKIPNVQSINGSIGTIGGCGSSSCQGANMTSFSMPDLENVTSGVTLVYVPKLETLSLPKLKLIDGPIMLNSLEGPLQKLSLPILETVTGPMYIYGKIDEIDFPKLKNAGAMNVGSTGDLDCSSLSKSLIEASVTLGHDSLICSGKNNATIGSYVDVTPTGAVPTSTSTSGSSNTATPAIIGSTSTTSSAPGTTQTTSAASEREFWWPLMLSVSGVVALALV